MEWEYFKDNIVRDGVPVAIAKINGKRVFSVYEGRTYYYTQPYSRHLTSAHITYHDARKMNSDEEENQEKARDVLYSALIHACEYFEENYHEQKSKIMTEFGS